MNWQEITALGVVSLTVALFILARVRARARAKRGASLCASDCGCGSPAQAALSKAEPIRFSQRKSGRSEPADHASSR
jgi:hypothetical protein